MKKALGGVPTKRCLRVTVSKVVDRIPHPRKSLPFDIGEPGSTKPLNERLETAAIEERFGWPVRVPEQGESFTLDGSGPA